MKTREFQMLPTSDLGTANGWHETPQIVVNCKSAKHTRDHKTVGSCLTEISCSLCNYRYKVDSSG